MAEWRSLLDETIDPKVAAYLEKADLYAEHVRDTFGQGSDDTDDIRPSAREHDPIVVTSDVMDFGNLPSDVRRYDASPPRRIRAHHHGRCVSKSERVCGS